jgi:hypothetical protein
MQTQKNLRAKSQELGIYEDQLQLWDHTLLSQINGEGQLCGLLYVFKHCTPIGYNNGGGFLSDCFLQQKWSNTKQQTRSAGVTFARGAKHVSGGTP